MTLSLVEISLSGPPGIVNNLGKMSKKGAETRVLSRGINIPCLKVPGYVSLNIECKIKMSAFDV